MSSPLDEMRAAMASLKGCEPFIVELRVGKLAMQRLLERSGGYERGERLALYSGVPVVERPMLDGYVVGRFSDGSIRVLENLT